MPTSNLNSQKDRAELIQKGFVQDTQKIDLSKGGQGSGPRNPGDYSITHKTEGGRNWTYAEHKKTGETFNHHTSTTDPKDKFHNHELVHYTKRLNSAGQDSGKKYKKAGNVPREFKDLHAHMKAEHQKHFK